MTFWFFTTPIVYSAELFPERFAWAMEWNLMAWFVGQLRGLLLFGSFELSLSLVWVALAVILMYGMGLKFFRRLSGHFEDFL
jgi:lipopolysaccharide transport system permease protein